MLYLCRKTEWKATLKVEVIIVKIIMIKMIILMIIMVCIRRMTICEINDDKNNEHTSNNIKHNHIRVCDDTKFGLRPGQGLLGLPLWRLASNWKKAIGGTCYNALLFLESLGARPSIFSQSLGESWSAKSKNNVVLRLFLDCS